MTQLGALEFEPPDPDRFPCLRLAYAALERGGSWPVVLNAANEMAVEAFLAGCITFPMIPQVIEQALGAARSGHVAAPFARRCAGRRRLGPRVFGRNYQYATIVITKDMTTILAFLFVLGVLVFVHELGHFLVARWHGVRVHTFSLGFGPKLFSFRRGDTEYCVSVVPLGGYVKLAGENALEEEPNGTTDPLASDQFMAKSKWVRFQVYVAGPVMNILLAIVVAAIVLSRGADIPLYRIGPAGDRLGRGGEARRDGRPARRRSRGQRGRRADVHVG